MPVLHLVGEKPGLQDFTGFLVLRRGRGEPAPLARRATPLACSTIFALLAWFFPFAVGKLRVQTRSVLLKMGRLEPTATERLYPSDEPWLQSCRSVHFARGSQPQCEVSRDFSRLYPPVPGRARRAAGAIGRGSSEGTWLVFPARPFPLSPSVAGGAMGWAPPVTPLGLGPGAPGLGTGAVPPVRTQGRPSAPRCP